MTAIPLGFEDTVAPLRAAHERILQHLQARGLWVSDTPRPTVPGNAEGIAAARAYPIQGILKYHGLADWHWRTAFMPSISVNNSAAYTLTWVSFEPARAEDEVVIGGEVAIGRERARVVRTLDAVREVAGIASKARVISYNVVRATRAGKGLGTSASASAALAAAALAAALGADILGNTRLLSTTARLLAGSGCRSAVGGVSLWLSYPGIPHEESVAVRLDAASELDDLRLITVPLPSRIGLKTEQAHLDAPRSPFFKPWILGRGEEIIDCAEAIWRGDWQQLSRWAELDSIRLHGVTMSGGMEHKLFAWEPENIELFRLCNELRSGGVPVYFSTDTGPTTVFLTHRDYEQALVGALEGMGRGWEVIRGRVAGPVELVEAEQAQEELKRAFDALTPF
ncbi:MAG: GHMP kinase [Chloroflexi bacterium]|nr:GHMP kinase [Chloroflexota bacterium]